MLERPTTSRIALSATAFTVPSGFWMLNRKSPTAWGSTAFGLMRHSTVKSTSTMFSSPVSIRLSSGTSRMVRPRRAGSSISVMPMLNVDTRSAFAAAPSRSDKASDIEGRARHRGHICRSAAPRRLLRTARGRSPTSARSSAIATTTSTMPAPPKYPPGRNCWSRVLRTAQRRSSRSGGLGPAGCGPEPHGPFGHRAPRASALILPRHR